MLTRDLGHLDNLIVQNLHKIRALPFDIVVHLPRSGTLPAALIATYMRKPLASVEEYCHDLIITRKSDYKSLDRILLVDDSIRTGQQLTEAIARIKAVKPKTKIKTMAVYSTQVERQLQPDLILHEHEEGEYIYPWFMWKTKRIGECVVDMDGVLCRDCERVEDDDDKQYLRFLYTADLKFKPSHKIGWIVTGRLEKYRPQTEEWLARNGVQYKNLIMAPFKTIAERKAYGAAKWKAEIYQSLPSLLFIESSLKEAGIIAKATNKKVWCIETMRAI